MKGNQKGYSLVEVLIALAIVAVVGTLVSSFLLFGTKSYGKVTDEVSMQEEAQILLTQLSNYLVDADATLRYFVTTTGEGTAAEHEVEKDSDAGGEDTITQKRIEVYKQTGDGTVIEIIQWDKDTESLYYERKKRSADPEEAEHILAEKQLLINHIPVFSADMSEVNEKQKVFLNVLLNKNDKQYAAQKYVYLRNKVSTSLSTGWTPSPMVPPEILGVKAVFVNASADASQAFIEPGGGKSLKANVLVKGTPTSDEFTDVEFEIVGATSADTKVQKTGKVKTNTNAYVTVGSGETAESFTIIARSVQSPDKFAQLTVKVADTEPLPEVTKVKVTPSEVTKYIGETQIFNAKVEGTKLTDTRVTWRLEGNTSEDTYLSDRTSPDADGNSKVTLHIGENETARELKLKATAVYKMAEKPVSDEASIHVKTYGRWGKAVIIYKEAVLPEPLDKVPMNATEDWFLQMNPLPDADSGVSARYDEAEQQQSGASNLQLTQTVLKNGKLAVSGGPFTMSADSSVTEINTPLLWCKSGLMTLNTKEKELFIGKSDPFEPVVIATNSSQNLSINAPDDSDITFVGIIYAPNATVVLNQSGSSGRRMTIQGMIVANKVIINNSYTEFIYDERISGEGGLLEQLVDGYSGY